MATPLDLSHHLSTEARLRKPNPMKQIWKLTRRKPNMVSLANGLWIRYAAEIDSVLMPRTLMHR